MKAVQVFNILAFVAVIVVNALSSTVGINGRTPGELSDAIPNLFVPSGLTFSVWGVIYLLLLLFSIGQARGLFSSGQNGPEGTRKVGWLFVLSSAANVAWIFLWHYRLVGWSLIAMLVLLISLIAVHVRLGTGRSRARFSERLFFRLPFSVYLGWITVATVANATALLVTLNWNGFGVAAEVWAIVMIAVAALVTLAMLAVRRDVGYALVVAWALAGIALKRSADGSAASRVVFIAAVVCGALVAAGIVASAVRSALKPLKS
jgi:hypothetical protein